MQTTNSDHNVRIRLLSESWIEQAGSGFDLAILVLAVVNVVAACAVISTIFYDAHVLAKLRSVSTIAYTSSSRGTSRRLVDIHPAEILPLAVSIATTVQGVVYIVIQSIGLHTLVADCEIIAQVVWPALWIVPYTMFVFGSETTIRSLQGNRFPCQRRRSLLFCFVAILVAVLLTWVPSYTSICRGIRPSTLVWWIAKYAHIGLAIGSSLLFTNIVCAAVITSQLMRTVDIDRNQRIAASRAVYYLIVSASLMTLTIPFFAQRTLGLAALRTAWVAEVSLNLFGLLSFVLHMSLRSNADRMAIQPLEGTRQDKKRLRLFGPSDLEMTMHITSPVLLKKEEGRDTEDNCRLMTGTQTDCPPAVSEMERNDSPNADFMNEIVAEYSRPVRSPSHVHLSPCASRTRSNYSMFPTFRSAMLRNSMSTAFSEDEDADSLQLPRLLAPSHHKREISEQTSATVPIGFRLSSISDSQRSILPSPTASSCCLPLQGGPDRFIESPPVSPLSSCPGSARIASQHMEILPLQPYADSSGDDSRLQSHVPDRNGPRWSLSKTVEKGDRPLTMKALPPIPSIDGSLSSSDRPIPDRLQWRSAVDSEQDASPTDHPR